MDEVVVVAVHAALGFAEHQVLDQVGQAHALRVVMDEADVGDEVGGDDRAARSLPSALCSSDPTRSPGP